MSSMAATRCPQPQSGEAPSGERLRGKGRHWCLQVKVCDPRLSALRTRCLSSKVLYKSTYLYFYQGPGHDHKLLVCDKQDPTTTTTLMSGQPANTPDKHDANKTTKLTSMRVCKSVLLRCVDIAAAGYQDV